MYLFLFAHSKHCAKRLSPLSARSARSAVILRLLGGGRKKRWPSRKRRLLKPSYSRSHLKNDSLKATRHRWRKKLRAADGNLGSVQDAVASKAGEIDWGDIGPDDEARRLNLITPRKVLQGIAEVRDGRFISRAASIAAQCSHAASRLC